MENLDKRACRVIGDTSDIRSCFGAHPGDEICIDHLNADAQYRCMLLERRTSGFDTLTNFESTQSILKEKGFEYDDKLVSITLYYSGKYETIYQLDNNKRLIISVTFVSGDKIFLESSFNEIKVQDKNGKDTLVPQSKIDFQYIQDWYEFNILGEE